MAGRFLLIEFDDEATATHLREQIDAATRKGKGFRVVGIFARPERFCRCGTWISERGKPSTLKRGAKFGWSVCTECKRPAPIMSFLKNLLAPTDIVSPVIHDTIDNKGQEAELGFYTYGLSAPTLQAQKFKG